MRLPSPLLVLLIWPSICLASELGLYIWALPLFIQRSRSLFEHPSPFKYVATSCNLLSRRWQGNILLYGEISVTKTGPKTHISTLNSISFSSFFSIYLPFSDLGYSCLGCSSCCWVWSNCCLRVWMKFSPERMAMKVMKATNRRQGERRGFPRKGVRFISQVWRWSFVRYQICDF